MSSDIPELRNRHLSIMDAMVANPEMNQNELAEMLHYSPSRFSIITNSPLFKMAFAQYRTKYEANLHQMVAEASAAAIKFSRETVQDENIPVPIRQISARDILSQGHAKAIERKATLNMEAELPKEMFAVLARVAEELAQPFTPTRLLERPDEKDKAETSDG